MTPADRKPKHPKRVLLIDGDVLCYKVALGGEEAVNWADEGQPDLWTVWADAAETKARFKSAIYALKDKLNADWAVIAITRDTDNFRKKLLPTYKGDRSKQRKPLLLEELRTFCLVHFGALHDPRLEADDILGILATGGTFQGESYKLGTTVIVSADKDLKTIAGEHYHVEQRVGFRMGYEDAYLFFMSQALGGDITDNYQGCEGIGRERAEQALRDGVAWEQYEHTFKSGPRKGLVEKRWRKIEARDWWHTVVSHYEKAGLTEEDALVQARCAHILTADLYDDTTGEIKLWQPPRTPVSQ